jgi:hypothetical protein
VQRHRDEPRLRQPGEGLTRRGATVGLLHTGSSYADDLSDDGVLYHYPNTNRPKGRDLAEIEATKAAGRLGLPVFVITYPSPGSARRDVHLGWVESWDDSLETFLITFGNIQPASSVPERRNSPSASWRSEERPVGK